VVLLPAICSSVSWWAPAGEVGLAQRYRNAADGPQPRSRLHGISPPSIRSKCNDGKITWIECADVLTEYGGQTVGEIRSSFSRSLVLTWRVTDMPTDPALCSLLFRDGILLVYGFRVLVRRSGSGGWMGVSRQGFWHLERHSRCNGKRDCLVCCAAVSLRRWNATATAPPHLASSQDRFWKELLFRGLLFGRPGAPNFAISRRASTAAAVGSHRGLDLRSLTSAVPDDLCSTAMTGIAFGAMRVWSDPPPLPPSCRRPTFNTFRNDEPV